MTAVVVFLFFLLMAVILTDGFERDPGGSERFIALFIVIAIAILLILASIGH